MAKIHDISVYFSTNAILPFTHNHNFEIQNALVSKRSTLLSWKGVNSYKFRQPGTFKCARTRCKTCPFICNVEKLSGPKRSIKITDHFTCTSANVIYCITCTLCKKLYIGETGRRLGDRFRENLRDVENDDKNGR